MGTTTDHWEENPKYTHQMWQEEVAELNTLRGYHDWVEHQLEQEEDDQEVA